MQIHLKLAKKVKKNSRVNSGDQEISFAVWSHDYCLLQIYEKL